MRALLAVLLAAPAAAQECSPRLDVRELVRVEYDGDALPVDPSTLPRGVRELLDFIQSELCAAKGSPTQEIVQYLEGPFTVDIKAECDNASKFNPVSRTVTMASYIPCAEDFESVWFHEITHVLYWDAAGRHLGWEWAACLPQGFHDDSIFDDADRTLMLAMDAETSPLNGFNEGFSAAVSLAVRPRLNRSRYYVQALRTEIGGRVWRAKTWERQQSNEHFVAGVLSEYLLEPGRFPERLRLSVRALRRAHPNDLQSFVQAVSEVDPVHTRGRMDRLLRTHHANWDNEREEIRRLRERED